VITGSAPRQNFFGERPVGKFLPQGPPVFRYRKLTSSFDRSRYSDIIYRWLDRMLRERWNRDPLDRFSPLNAWAELPRDVQAEEGSADETQLRTWLAEGWLQPTDLVEIDGQWNSFDTSHLFAEQVAALPRTKRRYLLRRTGWALAVGLLVYVFGRFLLAVRAAM
jgi:hypothetical protein